MNEDQEAQLLVTLHNIDSSLRQISSDIQDLRDEVVEQRTSKIELALDDQRRALESLRARSRIPSQSLVEFEGPGGIKGKLLGFSGVTIAMVILAAAGGIVAYLLLR